MLDKNKVNSLRDFALSHLPETVALSKKLYLEHHDSRAFLQAVATASTLLINSPLSTQVEKLAGRLLYLVGEHPDTHTEYLIDRAVGDKALGITLEDAARYAEQKKALTEAALIETAQLLCEFSGVSLPLWMNTHKEQSAPEQSPTTPVPVGADGPAKSRSNKSEKTLIFEAKVLELLGKFWDDRRPDTKPFKHELCKMVYDEMLRGAVRSKRGISIGSVQKAAKQWSMPIVLSAYVPEATYDEKKHPFKR